MKVAILLPLLLAMVARAAEVHPAASDEPLLNPGKGWVAYGFPQDHPDAVVGLCTTGYLRYEWGRLNPADGVYDWAPVDDAIAAWKARGKKFAFGVEALDSHTKLEGGSSVPRWVIDAGAKGQTVSISPVNEYAGTPGPKWVPDFADPVYRAEMAKFVAALAARYDGNPDVAFIDIRDYGNWGEGHMWPFSQEGIPPESLQGLVALYRDAFHATQLLLPWGKPAYDSVYAWAVGQGIGMRRDGICGNSDGSETARSLDRAPAAFEFYGSYTWLKEKGWWDGRQDDAGRGYRLEECVERGRPSWIGMSLWGDAKNLLAAERPLVERMANRMGYHFRVERAAWPDSWKPSETALVELDWLNDGVAPIYLPCRVAFALLDDSGQATQVAVPEGSAPGSWVPGTVRTETYRLAFPAAPAGQYRLAVGIVPPDGTVPLIRLGLRDATPAGWCPLGTASICP